MSNEEIRFSLGGASAYLKNGKLVYENDKEHLLRDVLQPIFKAIAQKGGNKNKIEDGEEKDLLKNLQSIFANDEDASISEDEMFWVNGFQKGGDIDQYIKAKLDDIEAAKKAAEEAKAAEVLEQTRLLEEENIAKAEEEQKAREAEEKRLAEEAKKAAAEKKKADRAAFDRSINKIKAGLSLEGVTSEDYTIKKGDSFWKIAREQLIAEGNAKPKNKEIMERIALIALVNDLDSVTGKKLYPNKTLRVPKNGAVTPPAPPAPEPAPANTETATKITKEEMESRTDAGELDPVGNVKVYKDSSEQIHLVKDGDTPGSGWTEIEGASVYEDADHKKYYVENAATTPPAPPASTETATLTTKEEMERHTGDDEDWYPVNNAKVYKDSSEQIHLVKDGDTPGSGWTEINASVYEDDDHKKYYLPVS